MDCTGALGIGDTDVTVLLERCVEMGEEGSLGWGRGWIVALICFGVFVAG